MFLQYGRNYSHLNHREACQLKMTVNLYQREACRQDGRNYCHSLKTARYFAMCHWILINWTSQLKNCLSGKRFHASCMHADVSPKTARLWFLTSGGSLLWRRTASCNICTRLLGLKRLHWEMQLCNFNFCIHPPPPLTNCKKADSSDFMYFPGFSHLDIHTYSKLESENCKSRSVREHGCSET